MRVYLELIDANWLHVSFDDELGKEDMNRYFTHKLDKDTVKNMTRHNHGRWDGKVRFYNTSKEIIYFGLLKQVKKFIIKRKYDVSLGESLKEYIRDKFDYDLNAYIKPPFEFRPYQVDTINTCLQRKRLTVKSPTASGKSFMIYNVVSALKDKGIESLIIVPSITLVSQMRDDMVDYGTNSDDIYMISSGIDKYTDKPIVISTWQSLQKLTDIDPEYFHRFECLIVDEAHGATADKMVGIVKACVNAFYRYGFSGTYYKPKTDIMTLIGLFGPVYTSITTRELIDQGYLPNLNIHATVFKYLEDDRRFIKGCAYDDEMDFIESHKHRNEVVVKTALTRPGNTLCLFHKHKHGELLKSLTDVLNKSNKTIYYITGKNKNAERRKVIKLLEANTNCLILATWGVLSTGVSIKNLNNLVLGSDRKSYNKVAQAIGRILRNFEGKDSVDVYDIIDDLSVVKKKSGGYLKNPYKNYAYKHGLERANLYDIEEFECQTTSIHLRETYEEKK